MEKDSTKSFYFLTKYNKSITKTIIDLNVTISFYFKLNITKV